MFHAWSFLGNPPRPYRPRTHQKGSETISLPGFRIRESL